MKRVLIGLLSGWSYADRRSLCRETWIPEVKRYGHAVYFLMGLPELERPIVDNDLALLRCPDTYPTLPQRTRRFCEWALSLDWHWDMLLKADDDSYFAPKRLNALAQKVDGDYVGVGYHPQMPYHSGGDGFFLSRKAATIIAHELRSESGAEDALVGGLMNSHGIPTKYMPGTMNGTNNDCRRPQKGNLYVAAHGRWLTREHWLDSHAQMMEE